MRRQISTHLQNRAKTIRTALAAYNKAAAAIEPVPRRQLKLDEVLDMVFLARFDLLEYARPGADPSQEPWAKTENRVLTDKYFEWLRAKEEIVRLNVEWRRLRSWIADEKALYLATINALKKTNQDLLASTLHDRWNKVERSHSVIRFWLRKTQNLKGFSGDDSVAKAFRPEVGNSDLLQGSISDDSNEGLGDQGIDYTGDDDLQDNGQMSGRIDNPDLLSTMIDAMGRISF